MPRRTITPPPHNAILAHDLDACPGEARNILAKVAFIDEAIRKAPNLDGMMAHAVRAVRTVFDCDQVLLLFPCDPAAPFWDVRYCDSRPEHPLPFAVGDALPMTQLVAEACHEVLQFKEVLPLGPSETRAVPPLGHYNEVRAALLTALHPTVGGPWLMGLHHCDGPRVWSVEERALLHYVSGRITDALSNTLLREDLERSREGLHELSARLFNAREQERRRVAREIHDDLGQPLLAVKVALDNALFDLGPDCPAHVQRSLASSSRITKDLVQRIRLLQDGLYPTQLQDLGLLVTLHGFIKNFENIFPRLTVHAKIHAREEDIPPRLALVALRITQEAMYNAAKHSQAKELTFFMAKRADALILHVRDDGTGFDPTAIGNERLGLGLTGMREQAELSGGAFSLRTTPGRGTTIAVSWAQATP